MRSPFNDFISPETGSENELNSNPPAVLLNNLVMHSDMPLSLPLPFFENFPVAQSEDYMTYFSNENLDNVTIDWKKSARDNNTYATRVGWSSYIDQVSALLLKTTGQANSSYSTEDFAKLVAAWQTQNGFTGDDTDGVIGPGTWKKMKPQLSCPAPGYTAYSTPPLTADDTSLQGYTCYVKIDLRKGNSQMDTTGIYVPSAFNPEEPFDLVIYLHGMLKGFPGTGLKIDRYWKAIDPKRGDLRIREEVEASGKNVILVAPSLGDSPNAGPNDLSGSTNGLDSYIIKIIGAIQTHILIKRFNGGDVKLRNIILACHSAGGRQMLNIVTANNPLYGCLISECWGFDSVYGDVEDDWKEWAQNNPTRRLFIYYFSTPARSAKLKKLTDSLNNVFVTRTTGKGHSFVPKEHLKERIQKIGTTGLTKTSFETYDFEEENLYDFEEENLYDSEDLTGYDETAGTFNEEAIYEIYDREEDIRQHELIS